MTSLSRSHLPGTISYTLLIVSSGRERFADQSEPILPAELVAWESHVRREWSAVGVPR